MVKNTAALCAATLCALTVVAEARVGGASVPRRNLAADTQLYQAVHFSEMLPSNGSAVVFEDGPVKFTASCKTVTYDSDFYGSYYSSSHSSGNFSSSSSSGSMSSSGNWSYSPSHSSSHYYPSTSSSCFDPCSTSSSPFGPSTTSSGTPTSSTTSFNSTSSGILSGSDDVTDASYPTSTSSYDMYPHTESFAALEMTYTADGVDYLYGSPSYVSYPDEPTLIGPYTAGESRTQTVFAGRDGGWGDMATLQSTSGHYVSINGDNTIGIHRDWTEYLNGGNSSFPEGVDCMIAGFITYVAPQ